MCNVLILDWFIGVFKLMFLLIWLSVWFLVLIWMVLFEGFVGLFDLLGWEIGDEMIFCVLWVLEELV